MITEYNYDNAMKVLEQFKDSNIATLYIKNENGICVMEYTLVESYHPELRDKISARLRTVMPQRLGLIKILNDFIITRTVDPSVSLNLEFNAVESDKPKILYTLNGNMLQSEDYVGLLDKCMNKIDFLTGKLGIGNLPVDGLFRKIGTGKGRKHIPVTVKDVICALNKTVH